LEDRNADNDTNTEIAERQHYKLEGANLHPGCVCVCM
jgi:hypothetical protein